MRNTRAVKSFEDWIVESKEEKEEKKEEKKEKNPLENKVSDLSTNMNNEVKFEKSKKLEVDGTVWHIVGASPDKAHRKLKVIYRDDDSEKEKRVDFFDFHKGAQEDLYSLLKKNI
jgi:hypothetical protein